MYDFKAVPVIIPSLEPDERLPLLLTDMKEAGIENIVLVDDGSGPKYAPVFERAEREWGCVVLRHAVNLGKGRALKTAFNHCLNTWPDAPGAITADSDGQHSPQDILRFMQAMTEHPDSLLLGCRDFDDAGVPFKSRWGNKITCFMFRALCGVSVSDTQTGLRGVPSSFMKRLMNVPGERFEFESNMLIETRDRLPILELPIQTIYDSKENHTSHFHPLRDSARIYAIFGKFLFSSLSSSVLDLALFSLFLLPLGLFMSSPSGSGRVLMVFVCTALARLFSASYNYYMNHRVVFHSQADHKGAVVRYVLLAAAQMLASAGLVSLITCLLAPPDGWEIAIKALVDIVLFFLSFQIQREFVYKKRA
ncbi:MAG TPA: bifunctional glycosyltransferase family 2/GtrA family protein [Candidatus Fournierella pullicola]|uniref:Bifunctional glycosyltransferase family 2/GtrA family protein n=1 Tax=Candidatus Allofournierella pullicola TaxID=2838596 RepID=A0A9D2AFC4_9FIRM|nr:bifunctional glycosyltransferase family 2/GtrA family protein [Candidatus Fournierella pullicola]